VKNDPVQHPSLTEDHIGCSGKRFRAFCDAYYANLQWSATQTLRQPLFSACF